VDLSIGLNPSAFRLQNPSTLTLQEFLLLEFITDVFQTPLRAILPYKFTQFIAYGFVLKPCLALNTYIALKSCFSRSFSSKKMSTRAVAKRKAAALQETVGAAILSHLRPSPARNARVPQGERRSQSRSLPTWIFSHMAWVMSFLENQH
jgi:hypothetical protein